MASSEPGGPAADIGKLVLRVALGGMMLLHGISKIGGGVDGIGERLAGIGLPSFIAYGVYVGEVLAPVLMIVGYLTRPAAAIFAFNMVVAVSLAHSGDILSLNDHGAWAIELQMLYCLGAVAVALLGAGRYSVSGAFD